MKRLAVFGVLLCSALSAFAQGFYYEAKLEGAGASQRQQMYLASKKMKMVDLDSKGPGVIIIRLDREVIWQLNPAKKTYSEMTFAQMEKMMQKAGAKMDDAMAKMQKELEGLPPDQRKMVEQMMKDKMPGAAAGAGEISIRNTGDRATIGGHACTKYVVRRGDDQIMAFWTTRDIRGFEEFAKDWKEFGKRMASMTPRFAKEMAEAYKTIEGFPMKTEMGSIVTTVTTVERRAIAASEFEIPAGYTKTRGEMEEALEQMDREQD